MSDTPDLIVPAEDVARRLGLQQPLKEDDRWIIEQAIEDAQADVVAYLGRDLTPQQYTEHHLVPHAHGWELENDPLISIVSWTAETSPEGFETGRYTVVYTAGIDAKNDPELKPILRYIAVSAFYSPDVQTMFRRIAPDRARLVQQVNVEGQSVTYVNTYAAPGAPGSGGPGSLPTLKSLDRWRLRRVYKRASRYGETQPWPYDFPGGRRPPFEWWW